MAKETMKHKIKDSFKDIMTEAIFETAKKVLHIETDKEGHFKSFKISKKTDDGTVYEVEGNVHYPGEERHQAIKKASHKKRK